MTTADEREATRALRGRMLRQEVYADDGTEKATVPYVVTEQCFAVRRLQSSAGALHGVFFAHARESMTAHTERSPEDPRVAHDLVLDVDDFGRVTRQASIVYGRATGQPEQRGMQDSMAIGRPVSLFVISDKLPTSQKVVDTIGTNYQNTAGSGDLVLTP